MRSKQMRERCVRMNERMSGWPSTLVPFFGNFESVHCVIVFMISKDFKHSRFNDNVGQTDGPTDRQRHPLIEIRECI